MPQKYGSLANQEAPEKLRCLVCEKCGPWSWTDLHGEAYCITCGVPYMLVGERRGACQWKEDFLPIVKEYFQATGKSVGGGTFLIARDYENELADSEAFWKWVKEKHPEWC